MSTQGSSIGAEMVVAAHALSRLGLVTAFGHVSARVPGGILITPAADLRDVTVADLIQELLWPPAQVQVGVVEMVGGVRSPQAADGDTTEFITGLVPDLVLLVADAGLGTLNGVRMSMDALHTVTRAAREIPVVVVLDRFDGHHDIHRRNRQWLTDRLGYLVVVAPGEETVLADQALDPEHGR